MDTGQRALEPTYPKRARQLVKQRRAVWLTEDTICLAPRLEEENPMTENLHTPRESIIHGDSAVEKSPCPHEGDTTGKPAVSEPCAENRLLLLLARHRLEQKRSFFWQLFDLLLIGVSLIILWVMFDPFDRSVFGILLFGFWAIRLGIRFLRFMKPSLKDGVKEYFRKRGEENLRREYEFLKKLEGETDSTKS